MPKIIQDFGDAYLVELDSGRQVTMTKASYDKATGAPSASTPSQAEFRERQVPKPRRERDIAAGQVLPSERTEKEQREFLVEEQKFTPPQRIPWTLPDTPIKGGTALVKRSMLKPGEADVLVRDAGRTVVGGSSAEQVEPEVVSTQLDRAVPPKEFPVKTTIIGDMHRLPTDAGVVDLPAGVEEIDDYSGFDGDDEEIATTPPDEVVPDEPAATVAVETGPKKDDKSKYDYLYRNHGGRVPVDMLRVIAHGESNTNPNENRGPAVGLLQVGVTGKEKHPTRKGRAGNVLGSFNKRTGKGYTEEDMLDANKNVEVATWQMNRIVNTLEKQGIVVDWDDDNFKKLFLKSWTGGYSVGKPGGKGFGVGGMLKWLRENDIPMTAENVEKYSKGAGASKFLNQTPYVDADGRKHRGKNKTQTAWLKRYNNSRDDMVFAEEDVVPFGDEGDVVTRIARGVNESAGKAIDKYKGIVSSPTEDEGDMVFAEEDVAPFGSKSDTTPIGDAITGIKELPGRVGVAVKGLIPTKMPLSREEARRGAIADLEGSTLPIADLDNLAQGESPFVEDIIAEGGNDVEPLTASPFVEDAIEVVEAEEAGLTVGQKREFDARRATQEGLPPILPQSGRMITGAEQAQGIRGREAESQRILRRKALEEEEDATQILNLSNKVDADLAEKEADRQAERDEELRQKEEYTNELRKTREDYINAAGSIAAKKWYETGIVGGGAAGKVLAILGVLMSGLGSALKGEGGKNQAISMINQTIETDLRNQYNKLDALKSGVEMKEGIFKDFLNLTGDRDAAYSLSVSAVKDMYARKLELVSTSSAPEQKKIAAAEAAVALRASADAELAKLTDSQFAKQLEMQKAGGGAPLQVADRFGAVVGDFRYQDDKEGNRTFVKNYAMRETMSMHMDELEKMVVAGGGGSIGAAFKSGWWDKHSGTERGRAITARYNLMMNDYRNKISGTAVSAEEMQILKQAIRPPESWTTGNPIKAWREARRAFSDEQEIANNKYLVNVSPETKRRVKGSFSPKFEHGAGAKYYEGKFIKDGMQDFHPDVDAAATHKDRMTAIEALGNYGIFDKHNKGAYAGLKKIQDARQKNWNKMTGELSGFLKSKLGKKKQTAIEGFLRQNASYENVLSKLTSLNASGKITDEEKTAMQEIATNREYVKREFVAIDNARAVIANGDPNVEKVVDPADLKKAIEQRKKNYPNETPEVRKRNAYISLPRR